MFEHDDARLVLPTVRSGKLSSPVRGRAGTENAVALVERKLGLPPHKAAPAAPPIEAEEEVPL